MKSLWCLLLLSFQVLALDCPEVKVELKDSADGKMLLIYSRFYEEGGKLTPAPPQETPVQCDGSTGKSCAQTLDEARRAAAGQSCSIVAKPSAGSFAQHLTGVSVSASCGNSIARDYYDKQLRPTYEDFPKAADVCGGGREPTGCFKTQAASPMMTIVNKDVNNRVQTPYRFQFIGVKDRGGNTVEDVLHRTCMQNYCGNIAVIYKKAHRENLVKILTDCGTKPLPSNISQIESDFDNEWKRTLTGLNTPDLSRQLSPPVLYARSGEEPQELEAYGSEPEIVQTALGETTLIIPNFYKDSKGKWIQAAPTVMPVRCHMTAPREGAYSCSPNNPKEVCEAYKRHLEKTKAKSTPMCSEVIAAAKDFIRDLKGDKKVTGIKAFNDKIRKDYLGQAAAESPRTEKELLGTLVPGSCPQEVFSEVATKLQLEAKGIDDEARKKIFEIQREANEKINEIVRKAKASMGEKGCKFK